MLALCVLVAALNTAGAAVNLCLGCHGDNPVPFRDPASGELRRRSIDLSLYRISDHAALSCRECHARGFDLFPHFDVRTLNCLDCHPRDDAVERSAYDFSSIEKEFTETVHFTEHREQFACGSCHEPHVFRVAAHMETPKTIVATHNTMCTDCHAERVSTSRALAYPAKSSLAAVHAWLPYVDLHLLSTRCVDCHTPPADSVSHVLLVENEAERGCVSCHTVDSVLLTKLYRHHARRSRREAGFVNAALLRDAYVVGATRNVVLDGLAQGLIGATLFAVSIHGTLRAVRRRRRRFNRGPGGHVGPG
ncbi:MAG: hypothetical protein GWN84_23935 [Gammaproteobacteria bacterium]|nr:hypothetical protein [Gammaproteobacteria bacterium]NIR85633.1 hypothetical protein [Gammaproteobacteria bacterium]NIR90121.1 hypothetical protein [Gammaproteobacteria bacterium]NIU06767.1 hypothetical protein [Gammaproteobacteria bacterium]NIV53700.1 hypothetical protein [Gammaproteobacteria bacterium]